MKINFKRVLLLFLMAASLWWDLALFSNWMEWRGALQQFRNWNNEWNQLTQQLKVAAPDGNTEFLLKETAFLKNKIFEKSRVKYSDAEILSFIARNAAALGLTDVRPSLNKPKNLNALPGWEKTGMKLLFRARFHEAARLLNMMEKSPYLLHISKFSINRGSRDPEGPAYATIFATLYRTTDETN